MLKLSEIVKDVELVSASRGQYPDLTFINVVMFYIDCLENGKGEDANLKYQITSMYNQIKRDGCANRSYYCYMKNKPFLRDNLEAFHDFIKTKLDKNSENYKDMAQHYKRVKKVKIEETPAEPVIAAKPAAKKSK